MKESPKPYLFTDDNPYTINDYAQSISRLKRPVGKVDVALDTDMFNEVDDQFALAYMLQYPEKINLKLITAAPFFNHNSVDVKDGMLRSYNEIHRILDLLKREEYKDAIFRGSEDFLKCEEEPYDTAAARAIIELSKHYTADNPLYIVGIAAATNIASAFILCPEIKNRVFVIWLGGMGFDWHDNRSFNAGQDIAAARVILSSEVPLVLIPGRGVLDRFVTTEPEMEFWLRGRNQFCDYIIDKTKRESQKLNKEKCWSRPISDVAAVAWLLNEDFMLDRLEHSPVMEYDHLYSKDHRRLFIRYVYSLNRDKLMSDLFDKLVRYK